MHAAAPGRHRGPARRALLPCCVLFIALLPASLPAADGAQGPDADSEAAGSEAAPAAPAAPAPDWLLLRADNRSRGLPGFGPNAFEALAAEYRLGGELVAAALEGGDVLFYVWATREALWYAPTRWEVGPSWRFRGALLRPARQQRLSPSELPAFAGGGESPMDSAAAGEASVSSVNGEWLILALDRPFAMAGEGAQPALWSLFFAFPARLDASARERTISLYLEQFARFLERAKSPADVSLPAIPARD